MSKQRAFFMSTFEEYQRDHPEESRRKRSSGGSTSGRKSSPKVYDCSTCKLCESCRSPKIERFGDGKKKILIVGLCPGWNEDKQGIPFVGASGSMLRKYLSYVGIDVDKDCWRTNVVRCYPGKDKKGKDKNPTKDQIRCCHSLLEKDIEETKPDFIICLGAPAMNAVLKPQHLSSFTANQMHGRAIPCHKYNCWVGCLFHPAFFLHRKGKPDKYPDDEIVFGYDLANVISYLGTPIPKPLTEDGNKCVTDISEITELLEYFSNLKNVVSYDYETTALTPWEAEADLLSISITDDVESAVFIPLKLHWDDGKEIFTEEEQKKIIGVWQSFLSSNTPKAVQNVNMEEIWNRVFLHQPMNNYVHDTMIAAHVINNTRYTTSLGFQAYEMTGHEYKKTVDVKKLLSEPLKNVCNYTGWDVRYTLMACYRQRKILEERGRLEEFYQLLHEGSKALVNMREDGIKIDVNCLEKLEKDYQEEKDLRVLEMRSIPGVKKYEEEHDSIFNPDSSPQLGKILYDIYKEEKYKETATKKGSTDEEALNTILEKTRNEEVRTLVNSLFRFRKCCSLTERVANYRNVMDTNCYVHPSYNLNFAESYRSSADSPNIQNVFKHDKELKVFRKCITPSVERKFPIVPVFEVHDSVTFDTNIYVVKEAINTVTEIMCSKWFDWQEDIPLEVEWEVGWNWYEMHAVEITESGFYVRIGKDKKVKLEEFLNDGIGRTRVLLEVDYSGMEVRLIAMISKDPELTRQIKEGQKWGKEHPEGGANPFDTHRRWAGKVFQKLIEEITKDERYRGKNGFVFPSVYNSTAKSIARSFPEVPVEHIIKTQKEFWEEYHYVKEWQNKVIHDYLKDGYVEAPTGWRRVGPLSVNQLGNNLVQGTAFHVLLRSLIELDKVLPTKFLL